MALLNKLLLSAEYKCSICVVLIYAGLWKMFSAVAVCLQKSYMWEVFSLYYRTFNSTDV